MPWNRSSERAAYRDSYIVLERAIRTTQELEDTVKQEVRQTLRVLDQAAESIEIQARSVALAERRVESTELFLQAGRAQIRDVLEAQESLISAQNALTAAAVTYRLAQLELQRDMGTLTLDNAGRWLE
jgi:outer membrane protein TolC